MSIQKTVRTVGGKTSVIRTVGGAVVPSVTATATTVASQASTTPKTLPAGSAASLVREQIYELLLAHIQDTNNPHQVDISNLGDSNNLGAVIAAGKSGGQTVYGGPDSGDALTLVSDSGDERPAKIELKNRDVGIHENVIFKRGPNNYFRFIFNELRIASNGITAWGPAHGNSGYTPDTYLFRADAGVLQVGTASNNAAGGLKLATLNVTAASATATPLTIKGTPGQTANLFEVQDSGGNVPACIKPDGRVFAGFGGTNLSASANAPLVVDAKNDYSYVAWFTSTNNGNVTFRNGGGQELAWISTGTGNARFSDVSVRQLELREGNFSVVRGREYRFNGAGDPNWGLRMTTADDSPPGIASIDVFTAFGAGGNYAFRYRVSPGGGVSQHTTRWEVRANGSMYHSLESSERTREIARMIPTWVDDTDASRKPRLVYSVCDFGNWREVMRHEADGTGARIGFLGADAAPRQIGGAQTATTSWTETEQDMLQKAYDCLRTFGLLT